jgi:glycosyltransferase involved in cell wall biosynthesis
VRIVYPLFWSRLSREASWEQAANTIAALARQGQELTVLMPRARADPKLSASQLRDWFGVEGDFRVVQRESRWAGARLGPSLMWLRQLAGDPELRRADLLYSRMPAMLGAGWLAPLPFATDHYRPWPDELPALRPLFRRTAHSRRCLGLILHSAYAAQAWRRIGVNDARILVAHNGTPAVGSTKNRAEARAALGLPADRPIAVYAGRINGEKGLDQLLALAALRPEVLFLLIGSEGEGAVEQAARALGNVRVLPWAEPAALPGWLAAADVLLIPASRAPLERFRSCVLPMKLFAYLAAGKPILAPVAPDTAELLVDGENALLVPPDAPAAAAAALDRLLHERGLAERLAGNALELSRSLSWDRRAQRIAVFLEARLRG